MYTNNKHAFYLRGNPVSVPTKWELIRKVGKKQLSKQAQLKLEWIIFYHTVGKGKATTTAKHFGISRKTLYKWLHRFEETRLATLEEESRAPQTVRTRDITFQQRKRITKLREEHLRWGKMKLRHLYFKEYGEEISSWKIQKVIEEDNLYYDVLHKEKQKQRRIQARTNPKKRISEFVKEHKVHHLWHVDTVVLTLPTGGYRYMLTAIDDLSKLAYARLYTTHSSRQAADFLQRLHYLTEGEIINLHHDNGSEFEKDFARACEQLSLPQWYSRVRTPKDNAVLERFNRTIQEEFVDMAYSGVEDLKAFNLELTEWLVEYNSIRPHQALDYLTPLEYIDSYLNPNLLPMYSSSTIMIKHCIIWYNLNSRRSRIARSIAGVC
jgi:transposase InsO family protein